MKQNRAIRFSIVMLVIMLLTLTSCAKRSPKVDLTQIQSWKRVALVETMLTPPTLPVVPLIQAGIHREQMIAAAHEIMALHQDQKRIDKIEEEIGEQISKTFDFEVLYGRKLLKHRIFKNIEDAGIKTYPTTLKSSDFNSIVISNRGHNFFDFSQTQEDLLDLFNGKNNEFLEKHAAALAAICKVLEVDSVAVATITVVTNQGVDIRAKGIKNLVLRLTFFDEMGKIFYHTSSPVSSSIKDAFGMGDVVSAFGGDLDAYKKLLDSYPLAIQRLSEKMAKDFSKRFIAAKRQEEKVKRKKEKQENRTKESGSATSDAELNQQKGENEKRPSGEDSKSPLTDSVNGNQPQPTTSAQITSTE